MKRSAEERLRETLRALVSQSSQGRRIRTCGMWPNTVSVLRLVYEVKRECAERAVNAYETYRDTGAARQAIRAAVMRRTR